MPVCAVRAGSDADRTRARACPAGGAESAAIARTSVYSDDANEDHVEYAVASPGELGVNGESGASFFHGGATSSRRDRGPSPEMARSAEAHNEQFDAVAPGALEALLRAAATYCRQAIIGALQKLARGDGPTCGGALIYGD